MELCAAPILITHKTTIKVDNTCGKSDLFRFLIISHYRTINLPRIMFMPQVKLNSPFLLGVKLTTVG